MIRDWGGDDCQEMSMGNAHSRGEGKGKPVESWGKNKPWVRALKCFESGDAKREKKK